MTRLPKFRAWLKKTNEMVNLLGFIDYPTVVDGTIRLFTATDDLMTKKEDIVLMQSTGLKDKNGTEIYENDILKLDGLVGLFEVRRANSGLYKLFRRSTPYDLMKLIDWIGYVEVVGNVYENKELLE